MVDQELKRIAERAKEAIEGPWVTNGRQVCCVDDTGKHLISIAQVAGDADEFPKIAAFISHARTDIPMLLHLVRSLMSEAHKWRDLAERAEGIVKDAEGIDNAKADQWFLDMWSEKG